MRNRIARIYPLYFLLTCLTILATSLSPDLGLMPEWHTFSNPERGVLTFLNLSFLRGFFSSFKFSGVSQGWSLTVEESFYLIAPFLLVGLKYRKYLIWAYAPAFILAGLMLVKIFAPLHLFGLFGSNDFMFNYTFFGRSTEFIIGIALGLLVKTQLANNYSVNNVKWTLAGICWVVASTLALVFLDSPLDFDNGNLNPIGIAVNNVALPIGIAMLFYGLIFEHSFVRKILESPFMDVMGKSSYAFYLVHLGVFNSLIIKYVSDNIAVKFVLLNILAYLLYKFVEHPLHKRVAWRRRDM
ncbi:acyltransferase [Hymenobacter lapidiphilus]|uniref:acyltransferase family protein n=1 Tax=Hymenobacter sp. CCM 8763 TaxID=2303334 RepID=UPI000E3430E6|nr:acyltransferase [Hymenobacter sp. CCM 8763]RFP64146.1 acyltransferase [Hymenobacter sp. CCM 8763]